VDCKDRVASDSADAPSSYLDFRTRQALHARPTRRRLLGGGSVSSAACDDMASQARGVGLDGRRVTLWERWQVAERGRQQTEDFGDWGRANWLGDAIDRVR
jgi:hypothetical protein